MKAIHFKAIAVDEHKTLSDWQQDAHALEFWDESVSKPGTKFGKLPVRCFAMRT